MAQRQSVRLDPGLLALLQEQKGETFTVQSLVDSYADRFGLGTNTSMTELRKWLYRRLTYLVKRQFLTKHDLDGEPAEYLVTSVFQQMIMVDQPSVAVDVAGESAKLKELRRRLSQYHVDMLACAGECKEYQQLVTEFPHLRSDIEQMHQAAKDHSSELLGQIRAINKILQQSLSN
ncbi:hypothetical protein SAMN04488540_108142 [Ferrimonas sediminum]|uniref:Uncharacterized protein n=1 Tax=Ferrimonas sediminum TaxID=718193 RepID=A0A1G8U087_9GAMM|nr:hypothetical protein [Ferrimonas sediminum]SDJ47246.1 hypothetical protein SAMN04488540_108142 [Ferrimonas sediminum]